MKYVVTAALLFFITSLSVKAQPSDGKKAEGIEKEEDSIAYLLPVPEHIILEVGGLATLPGGELAVCTRRGEVWIVSNP